MSDMQSSPLPANPVANSVSNANRGVLGTVGRVVLVLCVILVCLAVLEAGLRLTGRYKMGGVDGYLEEDGLSFRLKKNTTKKVFWPTMSFTVHTSDLGFRSEQPGPQPLGAQPYYAILGASDVFGNGLDYNETFVGIFADGMKRHGIDVLNMGVAGHHLLEQGALFRQFTASVSHRPQAVIIVFNPLFIGGYDDIHEDTVVRRGELYDKNHWKVALTKVIMADTSAVYCFFRDGIRKVQTRYLGRENISLSFFIQRFSARHPIRNPEKTEDFLKQLKDLEQYIRGLGARPICVYCPPAGEFQMNDLVAKGKLERGLIDTKFFADLIETHCAAEAVEFLNLMPPVMERFNKGEKLSFDSDGHYNAATSRLVGDYMYRALRPDRSVGKH